MISIPTGFLVAKDKAVELKKGDIYKSIRP